MTDRPILFSGPMVRAILDGTKTQTRRAVKSPAKNMQRAGMQVIKHREPGDAWYGDHVWSMRGRMGAWGDYTHERFMQLCPYGVPGDLLWVRETWGLGDGFLCEGDKGAVIYRATNEGWPPDRWRPSIHMPRWASRITLEVTSVRVERLQDISEADARAEGIKPWGKAQRGVYGMSLESVGPVYSAPTADTAASGDPWTTSAARGFATLWSGINGRESWDANPWVWVVGFKRVTP